MLVREATTQDAPAIVTMICELASTMGEHSVLSEDYVADYLSFPGNRILLAMEDRGVLGMLSYSIRPNLYHTANVCMIEELVVRAQVRNRGVGRALMTAVLGQAQLAGCAEISVTTMPDNHTAERFYRHHGLVDQAIHLEKHLADGAPAEGAR